MVAAAAAERTQIVVFMVVVPKMERMVLMEHMDMVELMVAEVTEAVFMVVLAVVTVAMEVETTITMEKEGEVF